MQEQPSCGMPVVDHQAAQEQVAVEYFHSALATTIAMLPEGSDHLPSLKRLYASVDAVVENDHDLTGRAGA